jgi:hypothetical protein
LFEDIASGLDQAALASQPNDGCRTSHAETSCPCLPSGLTIVQEHEGRIRALASRDDRGPLANTQVGWTIAERLTRPRPKPTLIQS